MNFIKNHQQEKEKASHKTEKISANIKQINDSLKVHEELLKAIRKRQHTGQDI